ncbi:MAG: Dabb family protein [Devosia sp.]
MIRHIVFFTAEGPKNVRAILDGLAPLKSIAEASTFEIVENQRVDQFGNEIDVVVYAEFEDAAALARYKASPVYFSVTRHVRNLRKCRYAADVVADNGNSAVKASAADASVDAEFSTTMSLP